MSAPVETEPSIIARVTVYPRREVLDPQGKAIADALQRVGFEGVGDVRAGKSFEIGLNMSDAKAAEDEVRRMCEKLLANTVVEDYEIAIETVSGNGAGA